MNFFNRATARRIAKEAAKPLKINRDAMMTKTLIVTTRDGREIERIEIVAKASEIERAYWNAYGAKCAEAQARGWYLFSDRSEPRELPDVITIDGKIAAECELRNRRLANSRVHA